MIEETTISANLYTCQRCRYQWLSLCRQMPRFCANLECRSAEWNGEKQPLRRCHLHEIKFPAPRKGGRPRTGALFDLNEDP